MEAVHEAQWRELAEPGTWGTGAQRLAVAAETRKAGYEAGILEQPADEGAATEIELPAPAKAFIRDLAVSPKNVLEESHQAARGGGLSDGEYVELVGIVSRVMDMDIFARGIDVALRPLPAAEPGEPSRERPIEAIQEQAFVPTIPNLPEGGEAAQELYGDNPKAYIHRGMSLVPAEFKRHFELEIAQYLSPPQIIDPDYVHHGSLNRPQVEIVAGRVSAINECFF